MVCVRALVISTQQLDGEREPDEVGYEMSMIFDKAFKGGKRTNDKLSQLGKI